MPWLAIGLYVVVFFATLHLVDRLASRAPDGEES